MAGDGAILETEVGLEHQGLACEGASPHQREGKHEGARGRYEYPCQGSFQDVWTSRLPPSRRSLQPLMPEWGKRLANPDRSGVSMGIRRQESTT